MATFRARPVPARRHDPALQNFVYKGDVDTATNRKDRARVAQLASKVRAMLAGERTNGKS
jgi:hypothetical protein